MRDYYSQLEKLEKKVEDELEELDECATKDTAVEMVPLIISGKCENKFNSTESSSSDSDYAPRFAK